MTPEERRRLLARAPRAGLCADCRHLLAVEGERSVFLRCGRSADDPAYPRYPALPVVRCAGHERLPAGPHNGPR